MSEATNPKIHDPHVRETRIREIVNDCIRRRAEGEVVSDESVIEAYSDLMPELADQLCRLQIIEEAQRRVDDETASRQGLHIRCPHCHNPVEVIDDRSLSDVVCPSCGSHLSLVDEPQSIGADQPESVGHFKLLDKLGMGAFGSVWSARDTELDRLVAVKIPRKGQMNAEEAEKVVREARASAQLSHPNIVRVHEVGREEDRVYIVTDLVQGMDLADWLTDGQPTPREAAELCATVADALHHAHERGVIHRDLKPSNIMLDTQGEPHLLDFGLAKREAGEITMTLDGKLLGTPAYMPPEQARGSAHDADRRSDVYSLGVILYELLTGERPFRGSTRMLLQQVLVEDAPSPRRLNARIPKDLETICLTCLEKDPKNRYRTAQDLADDLRRFVSGEPVHARPIGKIARTWRWCRRNPAMAVAAGLLLFLAVAGPIVATSQISLRLKAATDRDTALYNLYVAHMHLAHKDWQQGHTDRMFSLIDSYRPSEDRPDFRGWEWHYLRSLMAKEIAAIPHSSALYEDALAWSPDGRHLAISGETIAVWDVPSRQRVSTFAGKVSLYDRPSPVAWSRDGRLACDPDHTVEIWDPMKGERLDVLGKLPKVIFDIVWSPDGRYVAAGGVGDNAVRVWDVQKGGEPSLLPGEVEMVWSLGWHPHGQYLAVGGTYRGRLEVWDVQAEKRVKSFVAHGAAVTAVEWNRSGNSLATSSVDGTVKVWDPKTWDAKTDIKAHRGEVDSVCWSPDGEWLASSGKDNLVKVWDPDTGELKNRLGGHRSSVYAVTWSPDGNLLASGDHQGRVKLWRPFERQEAVSIEGEIRIAWSPDGRRILVPRLGEGIAVFNSTSGREVYELLSPHGDRFRDESGLSERFSCAWSSDGSRIAVVTKCGKLAVWDANSPKSLWIRDAAHGTNTAMNQVWEIRSVSFNPDDGRVATTGMDGSLRIWDPDNGETVHITEGLDRGGSVLWSPDGQSLAHADWFGVLKVWNAKNKWKLVHDLRLDDAGWQDNGGYTIAWSPDGGRLAGGFARGQIVVWDMNTGEHNLTVHGHAAGIRTISWNPDGSRLASGSRDETARVWDAEKGNELLSFEAGATVIAVAWSPEGHRLAVAPEGDSVQIYDATWSYQNTK